MKKTRKNTIPVLIDLKYAHHKNKFEETYGDHVLYSDLEQSSYLELKEMVFTKISKDIKFRKFCRDNGSLTVKVDMIEKEYEKFLEIQENTMGNKKNCEIFNFIFDFMVSDIKVMTKDDLVRNKKTQLSEEEYKFIENYDEQRDKDEDDENEDEEEDIDENEFSEGYL